MASGRVDNGPITLDKCTSFNNLVSGNGAKSGADYSKVGKFIGAVEQMFKCTGVCKGDFKYYFSDVNNGPPSNADDGCYIALRTLLDTLA